jgi:Uma2 family endonuclease
MSPAEAKARMTFDEYVDWVSQQTSGRYELVDGEVVRMGSEGGRHNLVKLALAIALAEAAKAAGLERTVFTDGMTVRTGPRKARVPDATVTLTPMKDIDAVVLDDPVVVVEIVSPMSEKDDTGAKLLEYFTVPTIEHYLIVRPLEKAIVHHQRGEGGKLLTSIVRQGTIRLDPPGIEIPVEPILLAAG